MSSECVPRSPKAPTPATFGSAIQRQVSAAFPGFSSNQPPSDPAWQFQAEARVTRPNAPFATCSRRKRTFGSVRMK